MTNLFYDFSACEEFYNESDAEFFRYLDLEPWERNECASYDNYLSDRYHSHTHRPQYILDYLIYIMDNDFNKTHLYKLEIFLDSLLYDYLPFFEKYEIYNEADLAAYKTFLHGISYRVQNFLGGFYQDKIIKSDEILSLRTAIYSLYRPILLQLKDSLFEEKLTKSFLLFYDLPEDASQEDYDLVKYEKNKTLDLQYERTVTFK